jgi:hypothetical protein
MQSKRPKEETMARKLRLPSPAMVVAVIALFVALTSTAVAGTVVARAKFADNAGKLQGRTAAQVAGLPGPASTSAGLVSVANGTFSLGADAESDVTVSCPSGKAISGGFSTNNSVLAMDTRPTAEGTWGLYLINMSTSTPASGTLYAVCLR